MNCDTRLLSKILVTFSFTFIAIALIIASKTPNASGYEISIYESFSWYFWFLICLSLVFGLTVLIIQAFAEKKSKLYLLGFSVTLFTNFIILILPIFRGYFISDFADEVTHLGFIKDILTNGFTGVRNYYPISHIIVVSLSYVSGLDPKFIIKLFPATLYIFYVGSMYLLAKAVKCSLGQAILISAFGSVLLFTYFNYLFLPTQVFLYYIPFILMIFQKTIQDNNRISWEIIFIIVLYLMPFTHPLGSLFLILIFIIFEVSKITSSFFSGSINKLKAYNNDLNVNTLPSVILFVTFTIWFSYFVVFRTTIREAYEWFVCGHGTPPVESLGEQLQRANFGVYDFIELVLRTFGHDFIFASLSVICILLIIRDVLSKKNFNHWELFLSMSFMFFTAFYVLSLIGAFISTGSSIRVFCWALTFSTILNGTILHKEICKMNGNKFRLCLSILCVCILLSSVIGIFSLYPSPYTKQANYQVTRMDWNGMNWYYGYKNPDKTIYVNQFPWRASHAIFGFDNQKPDNLGSFDLVSPHFGYTNSSSLAKSIQGDAYLIISQHTILFYSKLWPEHGLLNSSDFKNINEDRSLKNVYTNGELKIWKVEKL